MTKAKTTSIDHLRSSARRIWLAGLGALAEAEKKGDDLFQSLVKQGEKYEAVLRVPVEKAGGAIKGSIDTARTRATETFRGLEGALDEKVSQAMKRAGLASREELESLKKEVARLEKRLATRSKARPKSRVTKKKAAAKKTKSSKATKV